MKRALQKRKYVLWVSCMHLKENSKLQIIAVICIFFGMLIPFSNGADYDLMKQSLETYQLKNLSSTFVISTRDNLIGDKDIELIKEKMKLTDMAYTEVIGCKLEYPGGRQDVDALATISVCSQNITNFIKFKFEKGSFFSREDYQDKKKVCIVEKGTAKEEDIEVGNNIKINGVSYHVIGIIDSTRFDVIVPVGVVELDKSINITRSLYCSTQQKKLNESGITSMLTEVRPNISINFIETAEAELESVKYQMIQIVTTQIPLILVTLLFSLTNIICVLIGKIQRQKKSFLIKRALGATNKQIFTEVLIENFVLMLVACSVLVACFPITSFLLADVFAEMIIGRYAILTLMVVGGLITMIVSTILALYITSLELASGLRGGL